MENLAKSCLVQYFPRNISSMAFQFFFSCIYEPDLLFQLYEGKHLFQRRIGYAL